TVQTRDTASNDPLNIVTLSQIKGDYKLMYFTGYKELNGKDRMELYNLAEDPEELHNLYSENDELSKILLAALKTKLEEMNKPYLK
ncbi:MAG: DUF4976 domain-containing protein, partial [Anaerolineae bacterium]|nr:DUF4976 domain-containing protein [Anaerolineae bacterium]